LSKLKSAAHPQFKKDFSWGKGFVFLASVDEVQIFAGHFSSKLSCIFNKTGRKL
jgi:hypothetical protein